MSDREAIHSKTENPALSETSPGNETAIRWRLGCMGYSYPDWRNVFYTRGKKTSEWLTEYASHFDCVEMNTTFHAIPDVQTVLRWKSQVPTDFRFSCKAPRSVTHHGLDSKLERSAAFQVLSQFLNVMEHLGQTLGPVLLQFPPQIDTSYQPAVDELLSIVPPHIKLAVEFRSESWVQSNRIQEATRAWLTAREAIWVGIEHEDHPRLAFVPTTQQDLYLRLIGKHGRFPTANTELIDPTRLLAIWKDRIQSTLASLPEGQRLDLWILFNNDLAGHAPASLRRMAELLSLTLPEVHQVASVVKKLETRVNESSQRTLFD